LLENPGVGVVSAVFGFAQHIRRHCALGKSRRVAQCTQNTTFRNASGIAPNAPRCIPAFDEPLGTDSKDNSATSGERLT
jgi:hypothetical protein